MTAGQRNGAGIKTGEDVLAYLSALIASEGPAIAANATQRNAAMTLAAHLVAQQGTGGDGSPRPVLKTSISDVTSLASVKFVEVFGLGSSCSRLLAQISRLS